MEWLLQSYDDLVENQGDPRANKLLFVKSPCFTVTAVAIYLFFVLYAGPKFMKNRKPYDLKYLVVFYNFSHMCVSVYLVQWATTQGWFNKIDNWFCYVSEPDDLDPSTIDLINNSWWFYLSRFYEFTDTIFFVLRKKNNQISLLHLVHHTTVPIITWIGMKFYPIGHSTFAGYINAYVHIVMYTYYMLSAMGPSVRKYLWWKKYLTVLQLIQFVTVLCHTLIVIYIDCPISKWFSYIIIGQALLFFSLFLHFYVGEYTKKQNINKTNSSLFKILYDKILDLYNKILRCKAIFEMCVPNQAALFEDTPKESNISETKQKVK